VTTPVEDKVMAAISVFLGDQTPWSTLLDDTRYAFQAAAPNMSNDQMKALSRRRTVQTFLLDLAQYLTAANAAGLYKAVSEILGRCGDTVTNEAGWKAVMERKTKGPANAGPAPAVDAD